MDQKNQAPRIAFRYQEEVMTLYNRSVKKFLKIIWFVSLVGTISYFMLDRQKFIRDIFFTALAFFILVLFSAFLWQRTRKFAQKVSDFVKRGKKTKGKIIATQIRTKDKKLCLEVAYRDPETGEEKTFMTDPVTGDPAMLLKSPEVDVYLFEGRAFATNFRIAFGKDKPYGYKEGKGWKSM